MARVCAVLCAAGAALVFANLAESAERTKVDRAAMSRPVSAERPDRESRSRENLPQRGEAVRAGGVQITTVGVRAAQRRANRVARRCPPACAPAGAPVCQMPAPKTNHDQADDCRHSIVMQMGGTYLWMHLNCMNGNAHHWLYEPSTSPFWSCVNSQCVRSPSPASTDLRDGPYAPAEMLSDKTTAGLRSRFDPATPSMASKRQIYFADDFREFNAKDQHGATYAIQMLKATVAVAHNNGQVVENDFWVGFEVTDAISSAPIVLSVRDNSIRLSSRDLNEKFQIDYPHEVCVILRGFSP
ncbi:MAG: hypothetical protein KF774_00935 [Planctomyces sp.]|nr:hypothetical protein [Planctomyces sp.]